ADEGVFSGGLRDAEKIRRRRAVVSERFGAGGGGCGYPIRGVDRSANSLCERFFPAGIRPGIGGFHVAGLFWLSGLLADDSRSLRNRRVFHAEADVGIGSGDSFQ